MISIIMPLYNGEKFLHESISSVIKQSFLDWELIIINDGSSDNSENIAREFARKYDRIKLFSQANCGVSAARNKALLECCGDYITFLDADDELADEALSKIDKILKVHSPDVIVHPALYMSEDSRRIRPFNQPIFPEDRFEEGEQSKKESLYPAFLCATYNIGCICSWVIRRTLVQNIHFDETMSCYEDMTFGFQISERASKIYYMASPVYLYRYNPQGCVCQLNYRKFADLIKSNAMILDFFQRHGLTLPENYILSRNYHVLIDNFFSIISCAEKCKQLREYIITNSYFDNAVIWAGRTNQKHIKLINGNICERTFLRQKYLFRSRISKLYSFLKHIRVK